MTEKRFIIEILDKNNWLIEDTKTGEIANPVDGTTNVLKGLVSALNKFNDENEQLQLRLKSCFNELRVYHKIASCGNCQYHDYDWDIDDGYGGEEYEVCEKGNDVTDGICEDWEELE